MSDKGKSTGPGSRILRERAMKIMKETRAGIDPALLAVMKERFSGMVPPEMRPVPEAAALPAAKQIFQSFDEPLPMPESTSEPVDKQKVAQIILHYMKNREDKQKH